MISLDDYVSGMQSCQDHILYITGESCASIENSPFLGPFKEKNLEVLFMADPIDEYFMTKIENYENKAFKSCKNYGNSHDNSFGRTVFDNKNKKLCDFVKEILKDKVLYAKIGMGIINLPCVIVADDKNWDGNMERVLKAQFLGDYNMKSFMIPKRVIEINPFNDVIVELREKCWKGEMDKIIKDAILLLYETSMVVCGFHLENLDGYIKRVYRIVELGLGIL
jgi:molecular chaperone HtpG